MVSICDFCYNLISYLIGLFEVLEKTVVAEVGRYMPKDN